MARYLTRQRKQLLEYLSKHTDEQMTARQIADALTAESISISAVYRNLSALEVQLLTKNVVLQLTYPNGTLKTVSSVTSALMYVLTLQSDLFW